MALARHEANCHRLRHSLKDLLNFLEPNYQLPSTTHVSALIRKDFDDGKAALSARLHIASSIALTTDIWTSKATQAFATTTGHFFDDEWNLVNEEKGYLLPTLAQKITLPTFRLNAGYVYGLRRRRVSAGSHQGGVVVCSSLAEEERKAPLNFCRDRILCCFT